MVEEKLEGRCGKIEENPLSLDFEGAGLMTLLWGIKNKL